MNILKMNIEQSYWASYIIICVTCHYNDSNKEVGKDEVTEEEECNCKEFTAPEPMDTQLVLKHSPTICLHKKDHLCR